MKYSTPYRLFAGLVALLLIAACSSENDITNPQLEGVPVQVDIVLSAKGQASTRWYDTNAIDGEMMKNWIVIITNTSNVVEQIIYSSYSGEKEKDTVNPLTLTSGSRIFYSFANVTLADLAPSATIGGKLTLKSPFPVPANGDIPTNGIPMSNRQEITVLNAQQQTIVLQVVRMMAKVTLKIANASGYDVAVNSVTLSGITTPPATITTLPPAAIDKASDVANYTYTLGTALSVPNGTTAASPQTLKFYINESAVASTDAPPYHMLSLNTTQGSTTNEQRFALLSWNSFARNEHSIIPITLDDYRLVIVARDYPPIGVYPAVVVSNGEGNFTVTFSDGGDFELIPTITRLSDGKEMNFQLTSSGITVLSGTPATLFKEEPAYNATTKEIVGVIGNTTGTVLYQLAFDVLNDDKSVARQLTYKLYITR